MKEYFGKTWWGKSWLNSLKFIDESNRLPRGSSYARRGSVLKISLNKNEIKSLVQGSRRSPYKIEIKLKHYDSFSIQKFLKRLSDESSILSKLLNQELDPKILDIAMKSGIKLFPEKWSDLKMKCSCPDYAIPCKHIAAVIYTLSKEIDNNPFVIFKMQGIDLLDELNNFGLQIHKDQISVSNFEDLFSKSAKPISKNWNEELSYSQIQYGSIKPIHNAIFGFLKDAPAFYSGNENFKNLYMRKITDFSHNAKLYLKGIRKFSPSDSIGHRTKYIINISENFDWWAMNDKKKINSYDLVSDIFNLTFSMIRDYESCTSNLHATIILAWELIANGAILPKIVKLPNDSYKFLWIPAMIDLETKKLVDKLDECIPSDLIQLKFNNKTFFLKKDFGFHLCSLFITRIISYLALEKNLIGWEKVIFTSCEYEFKKPGEESAPVGFQSWMQKLHFNQENFRFQLIIEESFKKDNENFNLKILFIDLRTVKNEKSPIPLEEILTLPTYDDIRYEALKNLAQLGDLIPNLDLIISSNQIHKIELKKEEFSKFFFEKLPSLVLLNLEILLPKSLKEIIKPKASIELKSNKVSTNKTFIKLDDLLTFDWKISIGDELISIEEFKKLSIHMDQLIKYKTRYIYIDSQEYHKIDSALRNSRTFTGMELIKIGLSQGLNDTPIHIDLNAKKILEQIINVNEIALPKKLNAKLRPYQIRGYCWLVKNTIMGLGSVLADDMGLGKTLQIIALLSKLEEDGFFKKKKALIIVPSGLIRNWQSEFEKFSPHLNVSIFHGSNRIINEIDKFDVLITTYGMIRSDVTKIKEMNWATIIIDEAQNIKNYNTIQSKAIKSLKGDSLIALSGTPVENRLSELWSIFDFAIPGYLGNMKEFNTDYGIPIEVENILSKADQLKRVTSPFLTRRLKTDKAIISDLPDKIEVNAYAELTNDQAILYERTIQKAMDDIEEIDEEDSKSLFQRSSLILQMILALKQICNHPTLFLKNQNYDSSLSGKISLLYDRMDSILENREKVLIFTQYKEMGDLLVRFISKKYKDEPLFYHGGKSLKLRNQIVDSFQNNPLDKILILSLKAGGTGLNLTAANHVIHYDLWWNPAVETQATDRAFRIGQKKNVIVHRFITKNTFEEKIDDIIQSKKNLADLTVATGEKWIGNLSNKELHEIFDNK